MEHSRPILLCNGYPIFTEDSYHKCAFVGGPTTSLNKFKMADGGHIHVRKILICTYWMKIFAHISKMKANHTQCPRDQKRNQKLLCMTSSVERREQNVGRSQRLCEIFEPNLIYTDVSQKNRPLFYFWNNSVKINFNNLWYTDSWGNLTLADYKFAHFTWKKSPYYLVKCKKSRVATAAGWDNGMMSSSKAWWTTPMTSGEQDSKLVLGRRWPFRTAPVTLSAGWFFTPFNNRFSFDSHPATDSFQSLPLIPEENSWLKQYKLRL